MISSDFSQRYTDNLLRFEHRAHKQQLRNPDLNTHQPETKIRPSAVHDQQLSIQQDLATHSKSYSLHTRFISKNLREYHVEILAHAPDRVPVIEGPLRKPRRGQNGEMNHGYIQVSGHDPSAYEKCLNHLSQEPYMRSMWLQMEDGATYRFDPLTGEEHYHEDVPKTTKINTVGGSSDNSHVDVLSGIIEFHTEKGCYFKDENGKPSVVSPATILGHEGTHRYHRITSPLSAMARTLTDAGQDNNREELLTMRREFALAKTVGESQRTAYEGMPVKIRKNMLPTSTEISPLQRNIARWMYPFYRASSSKSPNDYLDLLVYFKSHKICQGPGWKAYTIRQQKVLDSKTFMGRLLEKL